MRAGAGPGALRSVALVSFAESAILPIPVDAVTLPVMLADRRRAWRVAWIATLASVLGGAVGYGLGLLLYDTLVTWLIVGAVTPIPYKLIAIASGVEQLDFALFLAISLVGRGGRFLAFAALAWHFGDRLRRLLDRHAALAGWLALLLLVGGFVAVEWLL